MCNDVIEINQSKVASFASLHKDVTILVKIKGSFNFGHFAANQGKMMNVKSPVFAFIVLNKTQ